MPVARRILNGRPSLGFAHGARPTGSRKTRWMHSAKADIWRGLLASARIKQCVERLLVRLIEGKRTTSPFSAKTRALKTMNAHYLAFDLGAESGRAIQANLQSGVLEIEKIDRFPNEPVRAGGSLRWDVLRLWHEMQRVLSDTSLPKLTALVSIPGVLTTRFSASAAT